MPANDGLDDFVARDRPVARRWTALLSILLSLAVLGAIVWQAEGLQLPTLAAMPTGPAFWIAFAGYYLITPASEWLIFRRIWHVPAGAFVALMRKKVYNELLLGYLGEAWFYAWARARTGISTTPFGAVKDVAILSAMAGNAVTLALMVAVLPFVGVAQLGLDMKLLTVSLGVLVLVSAGAMVLRKRVFSLDRDQLAGIAAIHFARIFGSIALLALLWHLALPEVGLHWWMVLATLRQLISRLPFVPNKDLLFAGVAVFVLGGQHQIAGLLALIAALLLACHFAIGALLAGRDLATRGQLS